VGNRLYFLLGLLLGHLYCFSFLLVPRWTTGCLCTPREMHFYLCINQCTAITKKGAVQFTNWKWKQLETTGGHHHPGSLFHTALRAVSRSSTKRATTVMEWILAKLMDIHL
jgi:hypothetical protein